MSQTITHVTVGVEFGSTRIKAVAVNSKFEPCASGDYSWVSCLDGNIWTYSLDEAWTGLKTALAEMLKELDDRAEIKACGISGMMHGYLAFDKNWNLLVPFRTWQNTITAEAAAELTELFGFNIPQRWSIAHLYQAVLNGEEHVTRVAHITTLAGYIHHELTGENVLGIGEAGGMFPVNPDTKTYDAEMTEKFNILIADRNLGWTLLDILPEIKTAGEPAGTLTNDGAASLDGLLKEGLIFAPPEGDAGTGMTAANSITTGTGNVSAGTSVFSMVVLDKPLRKIYPELDIVPTPEGNPVVMVHCNNCTNDLNAWVNVLHETLELFGTDVSAGDMYEKLFRKSLEGDGDCGGVAVCNYMAGEGVTHFDEGRPMVMRNAAGKFNLANFMRSSIYSTMATLKIGMDLLAEENVGIDELIGHGGLFKTPGVAQNYLAAACDCPVTCMETAGEGGPYGMALLAMYCIDKSDGETLSDYLNNKVFHEVKSVTVKPYPEEVEDFNRYMDRYKELLKAERELI